jgi:hypothetical protein
MKSLNALANHGYLPHSGVATPLEFDTAIETVPRIGVIFSQVLAFYVSCHHFWLGHIGLSLIYSLGARHSW